MEEELDPVSQRIKILIDELDNGVQLKFAQRVGAHQTTIHELFGKRRNKPGLSLLQKIVNTLPQIRAEWLLIGNEPMLKPGYMIKSEAASNNSVVYEPDQELVRTKTKTNHNGMVVRDYALKSGKPVGADLVQLVAEHEGKLAEHENAIAEMRRLLADWQQPTK